MASQITSVDIISERYASALYDLSIEENSIDQVLDNLEFIKKCIDQNKDLKLLVRSPLVASTDKLKIINKIMSKKIPHKLITSFLNIISNNKRFPNLYSIILCFKNINIKKRGNIMADITSADELTEIQKEGINKQLKLALGEKLSTNFNVNKKIIGGLIV